VILISLLAVASFRLGKSDLQIVGNMQQRKQALAAAQQTTEQVISSTQFTATPTDALPNPCGNVKNTACIDVNGDGVVDVNVKVVVTCAALVPILNNTPNLPHSCLKGVDQINGLVGALTGDSLCSNTVWDVPGDCDRCCYERAIRCRSRRRNAIYRKLPMIGSITMSSLRKSTLLALALMLGTFMVPHGAFGADDIDIFLSALRPALPIRPISFFLIDNTTNWTQQAQHWPDSNNNQGQAELTAISSVLNRINSTRPANVGLAMLSGYVGSANGATPGRRWRLHPFWHPRHDQRD